MADFSRQKKDVLDSRPDKSAKGAWDARILDLCNSINALPDYFTTSSCAGRVCLLQVAGNHDKRHSDWIYVNHGLAELEEAWKALKEYRGAPALVFMQEPPILHVRCRTLERGQDLLNLGEACGFSKSGILSIRDPAVLELGSSERLDVPVFDGKILVEEGYLGFLVGQANTKLERGWKKITRLEAALKDKFSPASNR